MELVRTNNDINGNPRYIVHFMDLINDKERDEAPQGLKYVEYLSMLALNKARQIGGKRYNGKDFGGGIVFQSYNTSKLIKNIELIRNNKF